MPSSSTTRSSSHDPRRRLDDDYDDYDDDDGRRRFRRRAIDYDAEKTSTSSFTTTASSSALPPRPPQTTTKKTMCITTSAEASSRWSRTNRFKLLVKRSFSGGLTLGTNADAFRKDNDEEEEDLRRHDMEDDGAGDDEYGDHRRDREQEGNGDETEDFEEEQQGEAAAYSHPPCRNIDEAMHALYLLLSETGPSPHDFDDDDNDVDVDDVGGGKGGSKGSVDGGDNGGAVARQQPDEEDDGATDDRGGHEEEEEDVPGLEKEGEEEEFEYDWILDGDPLPPPSSSYGGRQRAKKPRRAFGDAALDDLLCQLELEASGSGSQSDLSGLAAVGSNGGSAFGADGGACRGGGEGPLRGSEGSEEEECWDARLTAQGVFPVDYDVYGRQLMHDFADFENAANLSISSPAPPSPPVAPTAAAAGEEDEEGEWGEFASSSFSPTEEDEQDIKENAAAVHADGDDECGAVTAEKGASEKEAGGEEDEWGDFASSSVPTEGQTEKDEGDAEGGAEAAAHADDDECAAAAAAAAPTTKTAASPVGGAEKEEEAARPSNVTSAVCDDDDDDSGDDDDSDVHGKNESRRASSEGVKNVDGDNSNDDAAAAIVAVTSSPPAAPSSSSPPPPFSSVEFNNRAIAVEGGGGARRSSRGVNDDDGVDDGTTTASEVTTEPSESESDGIDTDDDEEEDDEDGEGGVSLSSSLPPPPSQRTGDDDDGGGSSGTRNNNDAILSPMLLRSLPLPDPSTLEGRFARRVQLGRLLTSGVDGGDRGGIEGSGKGGSGREVEWWRDDDRGDEGEGDDESGGDINDHEDGVEQRCGLDPGYFEDNFDPVLHALLAVPWDNDDDDDDDGDDSRDENDGDGVGGGNSSHQPPGRRRSLQVDDDDNDDLPRIDAHLTSELSRLDAAYGKITSNLVRRIKKRESSLEIGLRNATDIDLHLARAHHDVARGWDCIVKSRGSESDGTGVLGMMKLLKDADERDRLRSLDVMFRRCADLLETEEGLRSATEGRRRQRQQQGQRPQRQVGDGGGEGNAAGSLPAPHEFDSLIRTAARLREDAMRDGLLSRLDCLGPLRDRVASATDRLASRVEDAVGDLLSGYVRLRGSKAAGGSGGGGSGDGNDVLFPTHDYGVLLQARLSLHSEQGRVDVGSVSQGSQVDGINRASGDVASSWSRCITRALCFEAARCLARALVDPTGANRSEEKGGSGGIGTPENDLNTDDEIDEEIMEIEIELEGLCHRGDDHAGSMDKLSQLTQSLLFLRFGAQGHRNQLPHVYHKFMLLLAEVMHTHYLVTQWHVHPFDARNDDDAFLHRCNRSEEDSSDMQNGGRSMQYAASWSKEQHAVVDEDDDISQRSESPTDVSAISVSSTPTSAPVPLSARSGKGKSPMSHIQPLKVVPDNGKPGDSSENFSEGSGAEVDSRGESVLSYRALHLLASGICSSRTKIWEYCEALVVQLVEQFLCISAKKGNSTLDGGSTGENNWFGTLEGLHDVLQLSLQINILADEFVGTDRKLELGILGSFADEGGGSRLRESLVKVFRKHLRSVHVEAMNTLGAMLSNETWQLMPIDVSSSFCSHDANCTTPLGQAEKQKQTSENEKHAVAPGANASDIRVGLEKLLESFSPAQALGSLHSDPSKKRVWHNLFISPSFRGGMDIFPNFTKLGNPFAPSAEAACMSGNENKLGRFPVATPSASYGEGDECIRTKIVPDSEINTLEGASVDIDGMTKARGVLYDEIRSFVDIPRDDQLFLPLATQSGINGLAKWTARLLAVATKLPFIVGDVSCVISNLFDLYFLTVFRLCAGNAANENVLLGLERCKAINDDHDKSGEEGKARAEQNENTQRRGFNRQKRRSMRKQESSTRRKTPPVSATMEADVCAPLPFEMAGVTPLREFIKKGQEMLKGMVNLDRVKEFHGYSPSQTSRKTQNKIDKLREASWLLEKHIGAAYSCFFVAALLDASCCCLKKALQQGYVYPRHGKPGYSDNVDIGLEEYTQSAVEMCPGLVLYSSRIGCARAISGKEVILQVMMVGRAWEESNLNEHSNAYVDELCDTCAYLWGFLSSSKRLPHRALEKTWNLIVSVSSLTLLEGFSKILICSTEGRALMSMDMATFSSEVNSCSVLERLDGRIDGVHHPPTSEEECRKAMQHVDMYIKVFYYPEDDMLRWIEENYTNYHKETTLALIICGAGGRIGHGSRGIASMTTEVKALYESA